MTKILVTGGAGYIGSTMVPDLLNKGYEVTVVDNFLFGQSSLLDVSHFEGLTVLRDDVNNSEELKKLISKHDIIIPLAAVVGAPACNQNKWLTTETNVNQIKNILSNLSNDQRIVFPVTNSGYGIGKKDIYCDEDSPLNPISHYGKTKVEAEKMLLDSGKAITFRLATVFGVSPRMRLDLLVNDFVYRASKDGVIVLFESQFKRNYIHVRDISRVFLHGIENYSHMKGQTYNVGLSDANLSKKELCDQIKKHIPKFQYIESNLSSDPDKRDYIVSNKKIEATGWMPKYSLDHGIKELIRTYSWLKISNTSNV